MMYQFLFLDPAKLKSLAVRDDHGRKLASTATTIGPDTAIDTPLGHLAVIHLGQTTHPRRTRPKSGWRVSIG